MEQDYGEIFCQAVNTIIDKKMEKLQFDKTQICSITAIGQQAGQYLVSNGASSFYAYGSIGYTEGENVYVLIPNNTYQTQCLILGSYNSLDSARALQLQSNQAISKKFYGSLAKGALQIGHFTYSGETQLQVQIRASTKVNLKQDIEFEINVGNTLSLNSKLKSFFGYGYIGTGNAYFTLDKNTLVENQSYDLSIEFTSSDTELYLEQIVFYFGEESFQGANASLIDQINAIQNYIPFEEEIEGLKVEQLNTGLTEDIPYVQDLLELLKNYRDRIKALEDTVKNHLERIEALEKLHNIDNSSEEGGKTT